MSASLSWKSAAEFLGQRPTGPPRPSPSVLYADALFEVDFTAELRAELLNIMAEMREDRFVDTVPRDHNQPAKCAACGFVTICGETLIS